MPGPLHGLTVLDLTRVLAGPWAVQTLGDLGAEIIKIERSGIGDDSRHWGPPFLKDTDGKETRESAYYLGANRNKRSVVLDIARPAGQELVRKLAEQADIVLENYKVGDLVRYGLDYASLSKINPRLIYCSITGYGQDGPYAPRPGYDYLFQGVGGIMSVTGESDDSPGGGPQRVGVPMVDLFTGMYATVSVLAAVHHRDVSGEGQYIDLALFDSVMALSTGQILNYLSTGRVPKRTGNDSPYIAPYAVLPCKDGQLILASANQAMFESMCRAIGKPEMSRDPRFLDNAGRMTHREALYAEISEALRTRTGAEWEQIMVAANVPCGPINTYEQVVNHPQAKHRGAIVKLPHVLGVEVPSVASPMRFSKTPVEYRNAPPLLGEHTREVLRRTLGLDETAITRLEADGVISCAVVPNRDRTGAS